MFEHLKTRLLPHQERVVRRILQPGQPGLVVAHGLGSGKTLTSIAVQEALDMDADVIVPASLIKNYEKELEKHLNGSRLRRQLCSLQVLARGETVLRNPLLIVDEGHRGRNASSLTAQYVFRASTSALKQPEKRIVMTATPFYDAPSDIVPLLEVVAGDIVESTGKVFNDYHTEEVIIQPSWWQRVVHGARPGVERHLRSDSAEGLRQIFATYVDHHANSTEGFPSVRRTEVLVPMSDEQQREHDRLMHEAPGWIKVMIEAGVAPLKGDASQLNAFLSLSRQVCDEWHGSSPKFDAAADAVLELLAHNPRAKAVVYSNFIASGVDPYSRRLGRAGVRFVRFTGAEPKKVRADGVRRYNEGEVRVLMASSAGGEGLDLLGTRLVQVLEPHWNRCKLEQMEGRAIRFRSHAHLPPEEQTVEVQSYLMTCRGGRGVTTDQYLTKMSRDKEALLDEFRALLPKGD